MVDLTATQIDDIQSFLHVYQATKWLVLAMVPMSGTFLTALFWQGQKGVSYLQSMSNSLGQISDKVGKLEVKIDGLEKELGVTQIRVAERNRDE